MWLGKCVTDVHHFSLNGVMHAFLKKRKKLEKRKNEKDLASESGSVLGGSIFRCYEFQLKLINLISMNL